MNLTLKIPDSMRVVNLVVVALLQPFGSALSTLSYDHPLVSKVCKANEMQVYFQVELRKIDR